jgi:putative addiction module component (TIGR02574 family)
MQTAEHFSAENRACSARSEGPREDEDAIFADMTAADLLPQLLALPVQEREKLVDELVKSLEYDQQDPGSLEQIEAAWNAEIARRSAEVDAGTADLLTWEEHEALMDQRMAARAKPGR